MLETSPLSRQVAGIASAMRADARPHSADAPLRAAVSAALHALIIGALAQLLDRLAHLIALWQAGQLPPPRAGGTPDRHAAPRPVAAVPACHAEFTVAHHLGCDQSGPARANHHLRTPAAAPAHPGKPRSAIPRPASPHPPMPPLYRAPTRVARPATAKLHPFEPLRPPAGRQQSCPNFFGRHRRRQRTTKMLRYRNKKQYQVTANPPCHQCSNGLLWMIESIVTCATRGRFVPSTSRLIPRSPASDSATSA